MYTGDYFPRKIPGQRALEADPSVPKIDESGDQLLKHARVYTLAEKFQVPNLRTLASSKIHCVNSTAKGEIAYARYVYAYTSEADTTIRAPVANFWANRSHTLRAEAEPEFKSLCLEYPQFGYDVLSRSSYHDWKEVNLVADMCCSPRTRRETQARNQCQVAPGHRQRPQATSPQQRLSVDELRPWVLVFNIWTAGIINQVVRVEGFALWRGCWVDTCRRINKIMAVPKAYTS